MVFDLPNVPSTAGAVRRTRRESERHKDDVAFAMAIAHANREFTKSPNLESVFRLRITDDGVVIEDERDPRWPARATPVGKVESKVSDRVRNAVQAALRRVPELLSVADQQRSDAIIQASIEAAIPLQRGAREQAELAAGMIAGALSRIPMLTAREVGLNAASKSEKPEGLAAQWANRQQIFALDLREHGLRYPAFQFQPESGKPWPALAKILPRLLTEMPALDLLLWFEAPHPALGHSRPADRLHDLSALELALKDSIALIDSY